jgi:hypothetical protein
MCVIMVALLMCLHVPHVPQDITWATVIIDEAHRMKSTGSSTRAVIASMKIEWLLLLTGKCHASRESTPAGRWMRAICDSGGSMCRYRRHAHWLAAPTHRCAGGWAGRKEGVAVGLFAAKGHPPIQASVPVLPPVPEVSNCVCVSPAAAAGTPVQNNMRELFGILNLLDQDKFGGERGW